MQGRYREQGEKHHRDTHCRCFSKLPGIALCTTAKQCTSASKAVQRSGAQASETTTFRKGCIGTSAKPAYVQRHTVVGKLERWDEAVPQYVGRHRSCFARCFQSRLDPFKPASSTEEHALLPPPLPRPPCNQRSALNQVSPPSLPPRSPYCLHARVGERHTTAAFRQAHPPGKKGGPGCTPRAFIPTCNKHPVTLKNNVTRARNGLWSIAAACMYMHRYALLGEGPRHC